MLTPLDFCVCVFFIIITFKQYQNNYLDLVQLLFGCTGLRWSSSHDGPCSWVDRLAGGECRHDEIQAHYLEG
jgi:hypothetical protein